MAGRGRGYDTALAGGRFLDLARTWQAAPSTGNTSSTPAAEHSRANCIERDERAACDNTAHGTRTRTRTRTRCRCRSAQNPGATGCNATQGQSSGSAVLHTSHISHARQSCRFGALPRNACQPSGRGTCRRTAAG